MDVDEDDDEETAALKAALKLSQGEGGGAGSSSVPEGTVAQVSFRMGPSTTKAYACISRSNARNAGRSSEILL